MTNKDLSKAIDSVHKKIVDVESGSNKGMSDIQLTEDQKLQERFRIGKLAHEYKLDKRDLENPDPESLTQEEIDQRLQRIAQFEDLKAIAYQNAIDAGASTEEVDQFTAEVEEQYALWLQKELKNLKTVIHTDGTMTVTNTRTGEVGRFDNNFNPIE